MLWRVLFLVRRQRVGEDLIEAPEPKQLFKRRNEPLDLNASNLIKTTPAAAPPTKKEETKKEESEESEEEDEDETESSEEE